MHRDAPGLPPEPKFRFKAGDQVELLSGGPVMTISEQERDYHGQKTPSYRCIWFSGKKREVASFPELTLKAAEVRVEIG